MAGVGYFVCDRVPVHSSPLVTLFRGLLVNEWACVNVNYLSALIPKTSFIYMALFDFASVPTTPPVFMQSLSPWPSTVIWFFPVLWSFLPAAIAGFSYPLVAMCGSSRFRFYMSRKTPDPSPVRFPPASSIRSVLDPNSIPYNADVWTDDFSFAFYDGSYKAVDC